MSPVVRLLVALGLALGLVPGGLPVPRPAVAACGASLSADDAVLLGKVVFVGTVTSLDNDNRWATVRIEERWAGARDLPDTVVVHGGPENGSTVTDRTYTKARYLFSVSVGSDGSLGDDACTGTRLWTADLARLRPAGVSPAPDTVVLSPLEALDTLDIVTVATLLGALLVAIVAYIVILRRRGRPPDWMR